MSDWTLFSTHGLVLLIVADKPDATTRQLAIDLGITERSIQRVVSDLALAGYIGRRRIGRQNRYEVNNEKALYIPTKQDKCVADLLTGLAK